MLYMNTEIVVTNTSAYACTHNYALLLIGDHFNIRSFSTDDHLQTASMLC